MDTTFVHKLNKIWTSIAEVLDFLIKDSNDSLNNYWDKQTICNDYLVTFSNNIGSMSSHQTCQWLSASLLFCFLLKAKFNKNMAFVLHKTYACTFICCINM